MKMVVLKSHNFISEIKSWYGPQIIGMDLK